MGQGSLPAFPLHTMTLIPMNITKAALMVCSASAASVGALLILASSPAHAQGSGLCPGLSGQARTRCLQEENRRAARAAAEANRRAANWDATLRGMCAGNAIGSSVGPKAGGVAGVVLGKVVYSGAQALTYKAMGQSNPCK